LSFEDVSRAIAEPLATQNFGPSDDPATTNLLILVYWGTTVVPNLTRQNAATVDRVSESMVRLSPMRQNLNETSNGLAERSPSAAEVLKTAAFEQKPDTLSMPQNLSKIEAGQDARADSRNAAILGYTDAMVRASTSDPYLGALKAEIEQRRCYVVLLAYDYQVLRNQGQHRLLWESHFSIPERGNDFGRSLSAMASIASKFFGRESHGLVHYDLKTGHVEIGEPKSLGTVP